MVLKEDPAPLKLRVLILGPRGSGRKTQAKLLEKNMKVVYSNIISVSILNYLKFFNSFSQF